MEDIIINIVALFLLIAPPIDYTVAYLLYRASRRAPDGKGIAIRERATVAILLATATTINAVIALLRLFHIGLAANTAVLLLAISLTLVTLPNIVWAITYVRERRKLHRLKKVD